MAKSRHRYFGDQLDGIARELSKLAIACDIKMFEPGMAECGKTQPIRPVGRLKRPSVERPGANACPVQASHRLREKRAAVAA